MPRPAFWAIATMAPDAIMVRAGFAVAGPGYGAATVEASMAAGRTPSHAARTVDVLIGKTRAALRAGKIRRAMALIDRLPAEPCCRPVDELTAVHPPRPC